MLIDLSRARWRRASSVKNKYLMFELYVDDAQLVSLMFSNEGVLNAAFSPAVLFGLEDLLSFLDAGRKLAGAEKIETDRLELDRPEFRFTE